MDSITVLSPSKEDSSPEGTEKTDMDDQTDISRSRKESQQDTGGNEEILVSAAMKEQDHTEETNGVNFDSKDNQRKEKDDNGDTGMDTASPKPQADAHLSWQKKITFPHHPVTVKDRETKPNDAPSTMSGDDHDHDGPGPEKDKEHVLILPDPVIVRSYDFSPRSVQEFLLNYPYNRENRRSTTNLRFFNNEIRFQPNGTSIDNFHKFAFGKFKLLEQHHGYPPLTIIRLIVDIFNGFFRLESKD